MKKNLLLLSLAALALSGCQKYKDKEVYANVPVYMDYSTFRQSFTFEKMLPFRVLEIFMCITSIFFFLKKIKGFT
ncbi:MAG: hypothetical protein IPO32_00615 [Crocinitomicaceae bacterium]|nr:hypothetical protein [Crocinitomicaceae bacterium]